MLHQGVLSCMLHVENLMHEVLKKLQSGCHVWGVIAAAAKASISAVDIDVELVVDAVRLVLSFA